MLFDPRPDAAAAAAAARASRQTAPPAEPFLRLQGLGKAFGTSVVLRDIDLTLDAHELVCLLGPSGCGKTTLLRILCGIERAGVGRVFLQGQDITTLPPAERRFGVVFQSYALFPNLTALQNVAYGLRGLTPARARQRAGEMLELVGLSALADRHPAQMSGGQQQRVALARALAPQPRLLLLDEPLSALDAQVRVALRGEIRRLQQQLRMPTVLVTHDQDEALAMADRVVLMHQGRIAQDAAPLALYAQPTDSFVARFVGRMNLCRGVAVGPHQVQVGDAHFTCGRRVDSPAFLPEPGNAVLLGVRPEAIRLRPHDHAAARGPQAAPLPANTVLARVSDWTFCGAYVVLQCEVPAMQQPLELSLPTPAGGVLPWRRGEQVQLHLPPQALSVLPADALA